jgi:hypothetical protein
MVWIVVDGETLIRVAAGGQQRPLKSWSALAGPGFRLALARFALARFLNHRQFLPLAQAELVTVYGKVTPSSVGNVRSALSQHKSRNCQPIHRDADMRRPQI